MATETVPPFVALPVEIGNDELGVWLPRLTPPVAVTGGTGFIGVNLLEVLQRGGVRPRVLLRDPRRLPEELRGHVEAVRGDLDDAVALDHLTAGAGTVLHLAGLVRAPSEAAFERANRAGTANLVRALAKAPVPARLVHLSSMAAAGPSVAPGGFGPEEEPRPISAYGRSKLGGEREVASYRGAWTILRPPAVYGPRDIDILQFFRLVARGWVPIPAEHRQVTVVYVGDVVRAILAAAAGRASGRVLHLGEPSPRPMRELVVAIATAGSLRARVVAVPPGVVRLAGRMGDLLQHLGFRKVAMTSDKAGELLARHWTARTADSLEALGIAGYVPFSQGAGATWSWYRLHGWVPRAKMRRE